MFHYNITLSDPAGHAADTPLVSALGTALDDWSQHIAGLGTLEVKLVIGPTFAGRAEGSTTANITQGVAPSGATLVENGSVYALTTGQHVPGYDSDITITVDPQFLPSIDLNGGALDPGKVDPVWMFLHEFGHAVAFNGFLWNDGTSASHGLLETPYDAYLDRQDDGSAFFVGPNAVEVFGAPVPVTHLSSSQNFYHLADFSSDYLGLDLMTGANYTGQEHGISNVDLAILKDVGVPVTDLNGVNMALPQTPPPTTPPAEPPPSTDYQYPADGDWNAIGALVLAYYDQTGGWASFEQIKAWGWTPSGQAAPPTPTTPPDTQPPAGDDYAYPAADDWPAVGALVSAFHDANGWWATFDQIKDAGWHL